jgi:MoxR-like ATPase
MARTVRRATATKETSAKPTTARRTATKKVQTEIAQSQAQIATVPDKSFLETYVTRKVGNLTEFQIFEAAFKLKHNVLIEGPTGTGKTSSILAYAVHKNLPFYSVSSSNGTEPTQLFGKYIPDGSGGFVWQDGPVTDLVRHGGVLLINEVNFIPDRVKTVLFGLLDKRRKIELVDHKSEVIYAPDNFIVFADMNPDYEGTRPLNKAFRNRFATQLFFDYDTSIEFKLVSSKSLLELAKQLRDSIAQGLFDTPVSTNMLIEFEEAANELNVAFAIHNFVNHFPQDDRAAIKQVFDTWQSNIDSDFSTKSKKVDSTPNENFFTYEELAKLNLQEKRDLVLETGIDADDVPDSEIDDYLSGNHPYWEESDDWKLDDEEWEYEKA